MIAYTELGWCSGLRGATNILEPLACLPFLGAECT
jgi:hypothetical protein